MKRTLGRAFAVVGPAVCLIVWAVWTMTPTTLLTAQAGAGRLLSGEWRTYGADLGNTRYSPLDQIDAGNFKSLEVAWRFKTDNLGATPEFNLQSTPLMVQGVLYTTPLTMRGVPSSLYSGRGPRLSVLNRQATSSLLKLSAPI
jgi:glucose dehydrogenase